MCDNCGCDNSHNSGADHHHYFKSDDVRALVEADIISDNNNTAAYIRGYLKARGVYAINIVSSPGSGKTSIIEATVRRIRMALEILVIDGDQATCNDVERIALCGVNAIQINTQNGCHLSAKMVADVIENANISKNSLLMIENVGNLVCPAMFDLGENDRVVVLSTAEGDDKPQKYPYMIASSSVCIINKTDLLPYVPCDIQQLRSNILSVNPKIRIFEMSAYSGDGVSEWCRFIMQRADECGV